jgi:uncharacterized damage-inducible protein DinB
METIVTSLQPLIEAFKLQTRLYLNVTKDISDEHAVSGIGGSSNNIAWITGHLFSTRYMLGTVLGITDREPFPDLFERGKGVQEGVQYPSMNELTNGWNEFAEKIISRLEGMSEDELQAEAPVQTPVAENTLRGFITFICHHEAYHIGQISLARRYFGYEAMSYS